MSYQDIYLRTLDDVRLHGWFLSSAGEAKATVFFLHGNAENISTHVRSVAWLPREGYQVFLVDYRGYGLSSGTPSLPDVFEDIDTGFRWLIRQPQARHKCLFVLGQSLGASLAAYYVGDRADVRDQLAGVALDAPFASYRDLAREKLGSRWFTWPLQSLLPWLVSDRYSPIRNIQKVSPVPLLVFASESDAIVPIAHSQRVFAAAREPKLMRVHRGPHVSTFTDTEMRRVLLEFFRDPGTRSGGHRRSTQIQ